MRFLRRSDVPERPSPEEPVVDTSDPTGGDAGRGLLPRELIKRRVSSGAFFAGSWGVVNLVVGFFGSLALARMLTPHDFGIIAIGATVTMFAVALSDGGLGSGLIRREEAPTRSELRTALGLQLALTGAIAMVAGAVASLFGPEGLVVSLMMLALPLAAFQAPGRVVLTRAIRVREIATIDAVAMLLYYVWAVVGVFAGAGVWAVASGLVFRALVASIGVIAVSRLGPLLPSYRGVRALRPVNSFGLRFQTVSLAGVLREQGLNMGVWIVGGVSTLGLFSLARRFLELPALMFDPLHRVAFPFMTHVLAAREDPSRLIDRGIAVSAAAAGLVLSSTAAAAPELVPALFGEQWRAAGTIIPWICAALLVAGPLSVVGVGFLYALGEPSVVLRAIVLHTIALYVVAFSLLPVVGPAAIGMGSFAGAVVDALVMGRAISSRTTARPLRTLLPVLATAAGAGLLGLAASDAVGEGFFSAVVGAGAAAAVYLAALAAFQLSTFRETMRLLGQAVRAGVTRERSLATAAEAG
jgi:O-antigen/teichoic acid export membrane protein